jgi:hypothetical protein
MAWRHADPDVDIGSGAFIHLPDAVNRGPDFTSPAAKSIDKINVMTITDFAQLFPQSHDFAPER